MLGSTQNCQQCGKAKTSPGQTCVLTGNGGKKKKGRNIFSRLVLWPSCGCGAPQSQGCQAGSMRHRLSRLLAAATRVLTLLSPPSNWARLWRRVMMAVTAFWTSDTSCWESMFSGWPAGDRGMDVSSWVFLCQAMISSRRTAFRMPSTCRGHETHLNLVLDF